MARTGRPRIALGVRPREWLLARIRKEKNGCWVWTGDRSRRGGYGRVYLGIDEQGKRRFGSAAAALYREFVGQIPENGWLLHSCDNPPCVNPAHLFIGDHAANMRDMTRSTKGRARPSIRRLSDEEIAEIRASNEPQRALGKRYGVDGSTISRIRTRSRHYKHR